MKLITGSYATAIVYTDIIEETATERIRQQCDQFFAEGCSIGITTVYNTVTWAEHPVSRSVQENNPLHRYAARG